MTRLAGKRCLVTAAGQGIGRASVLAMQTQGAEVIATDINVEALSGLSSTQTRRLDVTKADAVTELATELGAVDVLFNCAGMVPNGTILECDEDQWNTSLELNLTAMYRMCRAFLPAMVTAGQGNIINMASVASSVIAAPNRFAYGTTKAAVIGLTKAIAADHVGQGIRCNAVCPGTVDSPSLHERLRATGDYEAAYAAFVARQPIGRIARAEEIADLVVYLASDESSYTTGVAHVIDGGWSNI